MCFVCEFVSEARESLSSVSSAELVKVTDDTTVGTPQTDV